MHPLTALEWLCRQTVNRRSWAGLAVLTAALLHAPFARAADGVATYLIGAGDVVRIAVYQSPDLTLEARVAESGAISYPLLGSVQLGGLSVAQAEAEITRGLRDGNFLQKPQVTVQVMQVRVGSPGTELEFAL